MELEYVAIEQMKAATMVLNRLDYAIYQVSSKTLTCHSIAKAYPCNSNSYGTGTKTKMYQTIQKISVLTWGALL